jgi:hypothetical protein
MTRSTDVVRTDTGKERTTVVTGPNGKSATHEVDTSFDADTNTLTRTGTTTGPNGKTTSHVTTKTFTPAP